MLNLIMSVVYDFDGTSGSFRVTNPEKRLADLLRVEQAKLNRLVISGASDTQIDELRREMEALRKKEKQYENQVTKWREHVRETKQILNSKIVTLKNQLENEKNKTKQLELEKRVATTEQKESDAENIKKVKELQDQWEIILNENMSILNDKVTSLKSKMEQFSDTYPNQITILGNQLQETKARLQELDVLNDTQNETRALVDQIERNPERSNNKVFMVLLIFFLLFGLLLQLTNNCSYDDSLCLTVKRQLRGLFGDDMYEYLHSNRYPVLPPS